MIREREVLENRTINDIFLVRNIIKNRQGI